MSRISARFIYPLTTVAVLTGYIIANAVSSWNDNMIRNATSGIALTSTGWNALVNNVDYLSGQLAAANATISSLQTNNIAPSWAVMAFNLSTCPTGWSPADGSGGRLDLRGEFIRGLDNGRLVDNPRTLGSTQADSFKSHSHIIQSGDGYRLSRNNWSGMPGIWWAWNGVVSNDSQILSATATGSTETRPRNVALLYCIKN